MIIPFIVFTETFGAVRGTKHNPELVTTQWSIGTMLGVLLIFIVVKKLLIDGKASELKVRIGIMADNLKVETDDVKKYRLAKQIAVKKMFVTMFALIIPIISVIIIVWAVNILTGAVLHVQDDVGQMVEYIKQIKRCVTMAGISFVAGVITQIAFPFVKARVVYKKDGGI